MKTSLFLGIIGMMLAMGSHVQAEASQKIYVEPSQLAFENGEMFALIAGEWIPLDAIYSDASGLLAAIRKDPHHTRWICSFCRFNNNGWDETCQNELSPGKKCGRPRPW